MKKTVKIDDVTINYTLTMSVDEDFSLNISADQDEEYLMNHENPIINNIGEIIKNFNLNLEKKIVLPDNLVILLRNDFLKGMSFYTAYVETVQYNPILEKLIKPIENYSEVQYNGMDKNFEGYAITTNDGQFYIEILVQTATLEEDLPINEEQELKEKLKAAIKNENYMDAAKYNELLTELKNKKK